MHESPAAEGQPEDTMPLGESHPAPSTERRTMRLLAVCLVAVVIMIPVLAVMTLSPATNILIAFSPLLLMIVCDMILLSQHYRRVVFWGTWLFVHLAGFGIITVLNLALRSPVNVGQAVTISLLIGMLVTLLAWMSDAEEVRRAVRRQPPPLVFTKEKLPEFVQSIEDKAKALNFAIGRVYRASNGGSSALRARLRVPREWYNEFNEANEEEREKRAAVIVGKIHDRLLLYRQPEKEVFHENEVKRLKNLKRHTGGDMTVLAVLKANDSDPVEHYYQSALETCEKILKGLQ